MTEGMGKNIYPAWYSFWRFPPVIFAIQLLPFRLDDPARQVALKSLHIKSVNGHLNSQERPVTAAKVDTHFLKKTSELYGVIPFLPEY